MSVVSGRPVWAVGDLCAAIGDALENRFAQVSVTGEVAQVSRASSGHVYFTLKDQTGQIRCAMFRQQARLLAQPLAEGRQVKVHARISVYAPRGDLQLIVEALEISGAGDWYERFLRLKTQLQAEGLFDDVNKRPIPTHPQRIGLVTSADGAALHDVITTLKRRVPHIPVVLSPTVVQGEGAPVQIIRALSRLLDEPGVDVVLVVRGGGAIEDLWAFNDERLVRFLARCPWPTISGVGHETDFTLTDFVCDLRAPTPTAAAQACARSRQDDLDDLDRQAVHLHRLAQRWLDLAIQRLDRAQLTMRSPQVQVQALSSQLDQTHLVFRQSIEMRLASQLAQLSPLNQRLSAAIASQCGRRRLGVDGLAVRLSGVHPDRVLQRGFVRLSSSDDRVITSVAQIQSQDKLRAHFHDGQAELQVIKLHAN